MERVYFRGLNAIRAWAAIFVVWWHLEEYKGHFAVTNGAEESWFFLARFGMSGKDAVLVFFALSGFLISYLLLAEIKTTGRINISKFYVRRSLRIWPLYYLLVLLAIVYIPLLIKVTNYDGFYTAVSNRFFEKFTFYFLFLPNVANALGHYPIGIMHLWTIGVEEAFYIFWPQLVQRLRQHFLLVAIAAVLIFRLVALILFYLYVPQNPNAKLEGFSLLLMIVSKYPFEGMAIGALGAYLLFYGKESILGIIYHPFVKWLIVVLVMLNIVYFRLVVVVEFLGIFTQIVLACLYTGLILNIVHDSGFLRFLDAPIYDFLGKLSYGIYMYHMMVVYTLLILFEKAQWTDNSFLYNVVLYTLVTGLTIAVSYVSYRWLELPFLNMKKKFQTIESVTTQGEAEKEQKPA